MMQDYNKMEESNMQQQNTITSLKQTFLRPTTTYKPLALGLIWVNQGKPI
jgi:hypothetical protein